MLRLWLCLLLFPIASHAADAPPRAVAPFNAAQARAHQAAWAEHLKTTIDEQNAIGMSLVLIPPGEFLMGGDPQLLTETAAWADSVRQNPAGIERIRIEGDEQPQHRVRLTRPYRIGATEVTIEQYRRFVTATQYITEVERFGGGNSAKLDEPDEKKRKQLWQAPGYTVTDDTPVTQLTWNDMVAFCNWLSEAERRQPCYRRDDQQAFQLVAGTNGYRLPSEAEWEYCCRAGTLTQYWFGNDRRDLPRYAWFQANADHAGAQPVAKKPANAFGLFDMAGNVWERCQDWHDARYYARSPLDDPPGPESGATKVVRGAGWHYFDLHCRSAYRNHYRLIARTGNTGFRVVCSAASSP